MLFSLVAPVYSSAKEEHSGRRQSPQADVCSLFPDGCSWLAKGLERKGNVQDLGHDGQGPNPCKERGRAGWVSRGGWHL